MKPEEFRALVLQAAIHGKLVPQDPNDEPASVLLEKIRAEKQRLISEGKIKKSKNDSFIFKRDNHYYENTNGKEICIDDEIPFEIPEQWAWVRLHSFGAMGGGKTPSTDDESFWGGDIPWISSKDVKTDVIYKTGRCLTELGASSMQMYSSRSLIFVMRSGVLRHTFPVSILGIDSTVNQDIKVITIENGTYHQYLYYAIVSRESFILNSCSKDGTTVESIDDKKLKQLLIPLPPHSEQEKIVSHIIELQSIADYQEQMIHSVDEFTKQLKSSILSNAIQGKLVPQDPNDEPVKIDCKNPIIRRDNSYYEFIGGKEKCIDEEIAFDIPDTWQWTRLGYISNYGKNESVATKDIPDEAYIIELENIEKDTGRIIGYTPRQSLTESSTHHVFSKGDVLYSKLRPYLNKVVIPDYDGFCSGEIMALYFDDMIVPEYAQLYLMSPYFVEYAMSKAYGCKMPRLGTTDGKRALVAIPPISEQKRIVGKIRELKSFTNQLSC